MIAQRAIITQKKSHTSFFENFSSPHRPIRSPNPKPTLTTHPTQKSSPLSHQTTPHDAFHCRSTPTPPKPLATRNRHAEPPSSHPELIFGSAGPQLMCFECCTTQSATPCSHCRALPRARSKFRFPNYRDSPRYNHSLYTYTAHFLAQSIIFTTQTNSQTLTTCKTTKMSTQTKVVTIHSNHQLRTARSKSLTSRTSLCAAISSILDDPRLCEFRSDPLRVLPASDSPLITADPLLTRHIHASLHTQRSRSPRDY